MQRGLIGILAAALSASSCSAEIVFDWTKYDKAKGLEKYHTKRDLEAAVIDAVSKYKQKQYADLGTYDFVTSRRKYTVTFGDEEDDYYDPATHEVMLNLSELKHLASMQTMVVHEFSHAYDFVKKDDVSPKKEKSLLANSEARATWKEHIFLRENKDKVPTDIYKRLEECYKLGYAKAYEKRGEILVEWDER
ncbi:hypothetical protein HY639_04010 [Candidatus Woesearchaeota archaeon]|nr:hypothetical protein [Candidatus Woesearchaeota archaeon]